MNPGDVLSYLEMCSQEGVNLQRGMNYQLRPGRNVILMSRRAGAPYEDRVEEDGKVLIYEGHDEPRRPGGPDPKLIDQPMATSNGVLTQNGLFFDAAGRAEKGREPEVVRVYEKLYPGIWVYNGVFRLTKAWRETSGPRKVFRFRLELVPDRDSPVANDVDLAHTRVIPSAVKLDVWRRDGGQCVLCGRRDNLHFDHDVPFSLGGSSLTAANIRLLCARHNLEKGDRIQ
jgi:hypothetical protein